MIWGSFVGYLDSFNNYKNSEKIAYICDDESITYRELMLYSDRLAKYILKNLTVQARKYLLKVIKHSTIC